MRRRISAAAIVAGLGLTLCQVPATSHAAAPKPHFGVAAATTPGAIKAGAPITIQGLVTPARARIPVWTQQLIGKTWHTAAKTVTTAGGKYTVTFRSPAAPQRAQYREYVPATPRRLAGSSRVLRILIARTSFFIGADAGSGIATVDAPFTVTGIVSPEQALTVYLDELIGSRWVFQQTGRTNNVGYYKFVTSAQTPGVHTYRTRTQATATVGAGTSVSRSRTVAIWHYLSDLPALDNTPSYGPVQINGQTYVNSTYLFQYSYDIQVGLFFEASYNLSRKCYTLQTTEGLSDSSSPSDQWNLEWDTDGVAASNNTVALGAGTNVSFSLTNVLRLKFVMTNVVDGGDPIDDTVAFGNARVLCSF